MLVTRPPSLPSPQLRSPSGRRQVGGVEPLGVLQVLHTGVRPHQVAQVVEAQQHQLGLAWHQRRAAATALVIAPLLPLEQERRGVRIDAKDLVVMIF